MVITKNWKTTIAPNISEVIYRVNTYYNYEKVGAYNTSGLKLFVHWSLWSEMFTMTGL